MFPTVAQHESGTLKVISHGQRSYMTKNYPVNAVTTQIAANGNDNIHIKRTWKLSSIYPQLSLGK